MPLLPYLQINNYFSHVRIRVLVKKKAKCIVKDYLNHIRVIGKNNLTVRPEALTAPVALQAGQALQGKTKASEITIWPFYLDYVGFAAGNNLADGAEAATAEVPLQPGQPLHVE